MEQRLRPDVGAWPLYRVGDGHRLLLRCILPLAVSKRPILTGVVSQSDPDILLANANLGVEIIGDPAIKRLLDVGGPACNPEHLDENDFWRVIDAEISIVRIDQLAIGMEREDLEFVMLGYVRNVGHRGIDDITDDLPLLPGVAVAQIYSDEGHFGSSRVMPPLIGWSGCCIGGPEPNSRDGWISRGVPPRIHPTQPCRAGMEW